MDEINLTLQVIRRDELRLFAAVVSNAHGPIGIGLDKRVGGAMRAAVDDAIANVEATMADKAKHQAATS